MFGGINVSRARRVAALTVGATVALGAGVAIGGLDAEPVVRDSLAKSANPRGAPDRTLGLSRVTIQPGAELALHHHEGTQIAHIEQGTLTYTVESGEVRVKRGDPDAGTAELVQTIEAGETAKIRTGQWIVEQPSDIHRAANQGKREIVIYLATLLRTGAPPSTPN
jgi:quercetin dioxygenase-like cupin family protein